jgi:hypothetical protein
MISTNSLPIRRLTLYKHGVAFVERQGAVNGDEVRLVFRAGEVNDALKSLLAIDRRDGQVLGIHYATPMDEAERLAESPITLSDDHSLIDLLRALRGWRVRLVSGDGTESQTFTGQLLGVDLAASNRPIKDSAAALLDEESGAVVALPLRRLRQVSPVEERAQQDLRFFLEMSRSEEGHRTISVRLNPGDHDLAVSYLVPSPTWRVSYRLIAEAARSPETAEGAPSAPVDRRGTLLLQGWGLFDNRLEEDLEGVAVTLVAGQPISFVYDLAASHIPQRPVVQDAARVAAAPVEFEAALMAAPTAAPPAGAPALRRAAMSARESLPRAMPAASIQDLAQQPVAATGSELGELFQYEVIAPVTVKRGESALVPILGAQIPYRRELLFNERKLPNHPVAALRFTNETGLVLERGPVTVLEDGVYHGEALVPFTREGGEVYLAFSVELGIKVTLSRSTSQETAGIRIASALLEMKQATVTRVTYRLENNLATAEPVTVEHPIWIGAELVETPNPEARTADVYRWTVNCPPRRATTFQVAERRYDWQASQLLDLSYANLHEFFRKHWLDAETLARIRTLLDERAAIARNIAEIGQLQAEQQELYGREEQLRKNMAALGTGGDEGSLRRQVVTQLQASEDRLNTLHARIAALKEENVRRQAAIDAELTRLRVSDTSAPTPRS